MLLWRKAPRIWKAKGYTHTTAADALEAEFGTGRKLGRTPISLIVKTQCEPCPPDVERFIRDALPVKDHETWAKYLATVANESPEDGEEPMVLPPRDFRDVARDVAAEVAKTVRGWLDALGNTLGAFATTTDAKLDTANGKLDTLQATLDHADAKLDLLIAKLHGRKAKRDKVVLACGLAFAVLFVTCQHGLREAPSGQAASVPQVINVNLGTGQGRAQGAADASQVDRPELAVLTYTIKSKSSMGQKKGGYPMPHSGGMPEQEPAPCDGSETTLYGFCWEQTNRQAPCPRNQAQEGEKCYLPVHRSPKPPASELPQPPNAEQR